MSKSVYSMAAMAIVLVCGIGLSTQARGQDNDGMSAEEMNQVYGMGVHSYFSGNPTDAEALLTTAIDAGTMDPRVYYFRGLARLAQQNSEGATEDFTAGAKVEASPDRRPVNVNSSLMRVQGVARLQIEKARAEAKQAAAEEQQREQDQRYNRIRENEARVLDSAAVERFLRRRGQTGGTQGGSTGGDAGDQQGGNGQGNGDQGGGGGDGGDTNGGDGGRWF